MPLETPAALSTPRSAMTHSTTVFDRIDAHSRRSKPSATRPMVTSRTARPTSFHVQLRHKPSSFSRTKTASPRCATALRNTTGIVSPGTTSAGFGRMWLSSQSTLMRSPPGLLLFPASLAARAGFLDAEVELADVFLVAQRRAGVLHDDSSVFQDVSVVGRVERHVGVLLDQQHRGSALAIDAHDDLEDLLRELRRQSQARFVEQDQSRRRHDRTRDRQHLLLSARQQACVLRSTLAQDREIAVDGLEVARDAIAILARIGAHHQVVVDRQQRKDLAPLGYVAQPALDDVCGVARGDALAVELDRPLERVDDARNRLQDRRLAGAIGPEDGRDLAFAHLQADPADGLDRAVGALDVEQLQDGLAHGAALRSDVASSAVPRYASITPGWPCTSDGVPSASISPWFMASTRSDTFET